jgi:hypothetical protein
MLYSMGRVWMRRDRTSARGCLKIIVHDMILVLKEPRLTKTKDNSPGLSDIL